MTRLKTAVVVVFLSGSLAPLAAQGFLCAGQVGQAVGLLPAGAAAKPAQAHTEGTRQALVLFARFRGEGQTQVPSWAADLFNPDRPGSFSHFYDTMSFGKLRVRGQVALRVYESAQPAATYLSSDPTQPGRYGEFAQEILRQADYDIDYAQFDDDGPDGIPNSGDDDGVVDAVFIVLDAVPARFLRGPATGMGELGFEEDYVTRDQGVSGVPIWIASQQGTIEQGRSFAGAMGAMCHEYGHVLGLIDLFNTDFLSKPGALPEEDSAGVGAWDLMGWGALGWQGNDGPNSFSAFSRMQLGWAEVEEVAQADQEVRLEPVGSGGRIVRVPLTGREFFLVEYRTWAGDYYDRAIPGEGLLVWHVERTLAEGDTPSRWRVDLEGADGRWTDAGYPLGRQPDPQYGGDNLDFWAHDAGYAQAHAGNLGDATDPFDGVRYTAFTPDTNPAAYSEDGRLSVRLEDIRLTGGAAFARVQTQPLLLSVEDLVVGPAERNGVVLQGAEFEVRFVLANRGGVPAEQVRVGLRTDDPLVEILQPEAGFSDLGVGQQSFGVRSGGFPRARFAGEFAGVHNAAMFLEIYADGELAGVHEFTVSGISPHQTVRGLAVLDTLGNQDGQVQPGELFGVGLELENVLPEVLGFFTFSLRSLHDLVQSQGTSVRFALAGQDARSRSAPEFLLPARVLPGTQVDFEFEVRSDFGVWKDTLSLMVHPGPDRSPPKVLGLQIYLEGRVVRVVLPRAQLLEGSSVAAVRARVHSLQDTILLAAFPLSWQEDRYEGAWPTPGQGTYLVEVEVEDQAGNRGHSRWQAFTVLPLSISADSTWPRTWEELPLPNAHYRPIPDGLAVAASSPEVLYATGPDGTWRSTDGGRSWARTGLMTEQRVLVDPVDPLTMYTWGRAPLRSRDGGVSWQSPGPQSQGIGLLAVDPVRPGRLYGSQDGRLLISEDEGTSWWETSAAAGSFILFHPADSRVVYAGNPSPWDEIWNQPRPWSLFHSRDGGQTWEDLALKRYFSSVVADPQELDGLYATRQDTLWRSPDQGRTWQMVAVLATSGMYLPVQLMSLPGDPEVLMAWESQTQNLMQSYDQGKSWEKLNPPGVVLDLVPQPQDRDGFFLLTWNYGLHTSLLQTRDRARTWEPVLLPETGPPASTVVSDAQGDLWAGSGCQDQIGTPLSALYRSADHGRTWDGPRQIKLGYGTPYLRPIAALQIDPTDPQVLLAQQGLEYFDFIRSADRGNTWQQLEIWGDLPNSYGSILADPRQTGVWYVGATGVFRSADFGATWEKRIAGLPVLEYSATRLDPDISSLVLDSQSPAALYTAIRDSIWRSADEGLHWEYAGQVVQGETILALAIHPLAAQRIYAATAQDLYVSEDQGHTWALLASLPASRKVRMRLRSAPADPQRLYWVTGPHLLETRDGGSNWRSLGEGLTGVPWYNDVVVDPLDPEVIYAATPWGVYRLDTRQTGTVITTANPALPGTFALAQNYPNPFNPQTTIVYQLPQAGPVRLSVYNTLGQRLRALVDQVQGAGEYRVSWDGTDGTGREVSSGVYLYRLEAGPFRQTRRLVLLR